MVVNMAINFDYVTSVRLDVRPNRFLVIYWLVDGRTVTVKYKTEQGALEDFNHAMEHINQKPGGTQ
jgi:hypothetical protein